VSKCSTTPLLGLPPLPPHSTCHTLLTLHSAPCILHRTMCVVSGGICMAYEPSFSGGRCMAYRPYPFFPAPSSCSLATPRAPLSLPLPAYTRMRTDGRAETSRFPRHASWSRLWGWTVRFRQVRRRRGRAETTVAPNAVPAWILNKRPHLEY
jgi:hypothetical protein